MDNLKKYAELIVQTGVNLQEKQILVINSPIECAEFTRLVAEAAYSVGAKEVVVSWGDELLGKIKFMMAPDEVFDEFPEWRKEFYLSYVRQGAAFISISASDPEILKDVNPERISRVQKASSMALKEYRERLMSNKNAWCVVSIPTEAWAKKVFPGLEDGLAIEKLWEAIFKAVRVNNVNPVEAWNEHKNNLKKQMNFMNEHKFKYLKYKNNIGTDFVVELPPDHIWLGGSEFTPEGLEFIANMPTEEIFTMPLKNGVNGKVVSSKPLNYHGNLIEDFELTFEQGKVIKYSARKGEKILQKLLESDDGAAYLGEVALVQYNSPISDMNVLFYNTLFDENASCHLAFGKAYPVCIKDGENMSLEELAEKGVNDSIVHEDFMIGTSDLSIVGIKEDGKEIIVFKNGDFVI